MHEELMSMQSESSHFYEVLPNMLYAGACPWESIHEHGHLHELLDMGIRHFITLRNDITLDEIYASLPSDMQKPIITRFPIKDFSVPDEALTHEILTFMQSEIEKGSMLYLSCAHGLGRTGTIIGCYLSEYAAMTGSEALRYMNECRKIAHFRIDSPSPETHEQYTYVMQRKSRHAHES